MDKYISMEELLTEWFSVYDYLPNVNKWVKVLVGNKIYTAHIVKSDPEITVFKTAPIVPDGDVFLLKNSVRYWKVLTDKEDKEVNDLMKHIESLTYNSEFKAEFQEEELSKDK